VYSYDMVTRKYTELAPLPSAAAGNHSGVAAAGGFIYVIAGQTGNTYGVGTNTTWRYNIAANKWEKFVNLPEVRYGGAAFVDSSGWLHYVGGDKADRVTPTTDHWAINLNAPGSDWVRKASMPLPGDHLSHAGINGKFYLFGGEHGHEGLNGKSGGTYVQHNYTFQYNPANDTWTRKANMPLAISHIEGSTLVINGRAVLIGGLLDGGSPNQTSRVQVYDPVVNAWKSLTTRYPRRIIGASSGYWNGKIYMSEGFSPDSTDRQVGFEGAVKFG
jgi:N-acetylneuraminic acid mutarotase